MGCTQHDAGGKQCTLCSNIKVDAVVDFVPEEGLNWYTDIVAYNTALNSINVDEWNNVIDGTTVDIKAGTAGTKKVVALFKTVGADVAEIVRTNTMYVRNAKNLYVITGITRDGNPYTLGAIGDDTIELAVSSAEGPGTLEDLTMEVKILEYRYETVIWTSGDVAATETVNVAKADWFDQIVDPAEGKPAIRNAVRVQFVLKDASGAEVGSTKRVLYL